MSWLLNATYVCFLVMASPWLLWRYFQGKGRRGWKQKLFGLVAERKSDNPCIWLHAVSVGEVNLLTPVLNRWQELQPELEFVISTTTETGFDLARRRYPEHYVCFCPMDFTWAIKRVLKRFRPDMLVLAELELWPNLIRTTRQAGIPVAVVNGRLSANSFNGYRWLSRVLESTFKDLSLVAAQNATYAGRFCALGCDPAKVFVTGSVKFDGVETNRNNPRTRQLASLAGIAAKDLVFMAGSTQVEEDLIAASVYQQMSRNNPNLRLILVPRHPDRCGVLVDKLKLAGIPTVLRSKLSGTNTPTVESFVWRNQIKPVLIVDVIGELGAWWGCADAAYVGGSMGTRGGQNMIEPAAYGVPVSFGPNTENFREIVNELLSQEAATVVENAKDLKAFLNLALFQSDWAREMGKRSQTVILEHHGASGRTAGQLRDLHQQSADLANSKSAEARAA